MKLTANIQLPLLCRGYMLEVKGQRSRQLSSNLVYTVLYLMNYLSNFDETYN